LIRIYTNEGSGIAVGTVLKDASDAKG
jgi:hypothetical protein